MRFMLKPLRSFCDLQVQNSKHKAKKNPHQVRKVHSENPPQLVHPPAALTASSQNSNQVRR